MSKKKNAAQKRHERNARSKAKNKNTSRNRTTSSGNSLAPSGLRNHGNTCYYNSTMQCLSQVYTLFNLLEERNSSNYVWKTTIVSKEDKEKRFKLENLSFPLKAPRSSLVTSFLKLVKEILSKQ